MFFVTKAAWNYLEAGHGKGPCDGLGSTTKRMADNDVKKHKYVIQDAFHFYSWTLAEASIQQIPLRIYFLRRYSPLYRRNIKSMSPRQIDGTMKLHVSVGSCDSINYRNIFCYPSIIRPNY